MAFNYIDLFCGIGGFHQAIERVMADRGIESCCLFAADNDYYASQIYNNTYNINSFYDMSKRETMNAIRDAIGDNDLDLICGGFPCQSFSHAGKQEGFTNQYKGNLFFQIASLAKIYRPKMLLLENVRNLKSHDKGNTWSVIYETLTRMGYHVDDTILGPNRLENNPIPAIRDRIYIMCYRLDILNERNHLFGGVTVAKQVTSIYNRNHNLNRNLFMRNVNMNIDEQKIQIINMWEDFRNRVIAQDQKLVSPIWLEFFKEEIDYKEFPDWKQKIIRRNQNFYFQINEIYETWYEEYHDLLESTIPSNRKFEWNAGDRILDIWDGIIQFRPSGVRVKDSTALPTFVAINQTPIIGREQRYLTPMEMAIIYGFRDINLMNQPLNQAYKQMGNTVSVDVVISLLNRMVENTDFIIEGGNIIWEKR